MEYILDTHPLLFFLLNPSKLSKNVSNLLHESRNTFFVPTMVILEIKYLVEVGKIEISVNEVIAYINKKENFEIISFSPIELIDSLDLTSSRDPFDRIILASAMSRKIFIITRDRWMTKNYNQTVW